MNTAILISVCVIVIVLVLGFMMNNKGNNITNSRKPSIRLRASKKSNDSPDLISALTNVSNQISSYLGYDPTGGFAPYNSTTFQQYLSSAVQLLGQGQSSGSVSPQLGSYLGNLLKEIQAISPLDKGSFDEAHIGAIAGSIFVCVLALQNGISWEPVDSSLIQDVLHAIDLYEDFTSGKQSSTDAGAYLNDPVVYNLKMDADSGYPSGTVQVLDELTAAAEADVWYLNNNNMNKARAWCDLGMFEGFKCLYTADGNTC